MANLTERLAFLISANADSAIRAFQKTGNAAEKELGRAEDKITKVGASLTKFGAGGMAFAGIAARGLIEFAQASEEAELQSRKLANSIANSSKMSEGAQDRLEDLAKSLQKVTTADGDAVIGAQSLLVQFGLTEEQITAITPLVVDLSQKMGVDMDTAAKAVAKSATGSTTALRKMGIIVKSTKDGGDAFTNTMDSLRDTVGGFAQKEAETFSGKIERLKVSLGDLQEGVGKGVIDVFGGMVNGLTSVSNKLGDIDPGLQRTAGQFAGIATAGIGLVGSLSFVAGQTIKMRARFVDADGALNKFGQTAKFTGFALAGLAATQGIMTLMNQLSDDAGNIERKMQAATIAIDGYAKGTNNATDVMDAFNAQVAAAGKGVKISHLWEDFGKEVKVAGAESKRNIEEIDEAFKKLMTTSPKMAQTLLDVWRAQADAMDHSSQEYEDNMMLIERYQGRLDLAVGSSNALAGASDETSTAIEGVGNEASIAAGKVGELTAAWQIALGNFDRQETLDNIATTMGEVQEAVALAFGEPTQENIANAEEKVAQLYEQTARYLEQLGDVPPDKQTEILIALNNNDYWTVAALLADLEKDRTAKVNVVPYAPGLGPVAPTAGQSVFGRRAMGGAVTAGQPYLVGEQGAEVVIPNNSGTVIPNGAIGGNSYTINVTVPMLGDTSSVGDQIVSAIRAYERRNGNLWRR